MREPAHRPGAGDAAALALVEGLPSDVPLGFALLDAAGAALARSPSVPPELPAALAPELAAVLAGGNPVRGARVEVSGPGGERRCWESELYPLPGPGAARVGVVTADVTHQIRTEQGLRASERQLAAAQRIARMGWWAWTADPREFTVSPQLADVLGLDPARAAGLTEADLMAIVIPEDAPTMGLEVRRAVAEGRSFRFRARFRLPDSRMRLLETEGAATGDPGGEPTEIHGFSQDVTEVARAAVLQQTLAELGRLGLAGGPLDELLSRACELVRDALWVESVVAHVDGSVSVRDESRPFEAEETAFLDAVSHVLAEAIARRRTTDEIAEAAIARGRLVGQALDAEARARRVISDHLHDGPLQELLAAVNSLYSLSPSSEATVVQDDLRTIARELREVMVALHPTVLHYGGLGTALAAVAEQQARAWGISVAVDVDPDAYGAHDELLLSVARELLADAGRHAGAAAATLSLRLIGAWLCLEISEDGPHADDHDRLGRATSAERVAAVGGRLTAEPIGERSGDAGSARGRRGSRVYVEVPVA
jgi:signal transduction histidine kinase